MLLSKPILVCLVYSVYYQFITTQEINNVQIIQAYSYFILILSGI